MSPAEFEKRLEALAPTEQSEAMVIILKELLGKPAGVALKRILRDCAVQAQGIMLAHNASSDQRSYAAGYLSAIRSLWNSLKQGEEADLLGFREEAKRRAPGGFAGMNGQVIAPEDVPV